MGRQHQSAAAIWKVAHIRVGPRHRTDLGDVGALAESIAAVIRLLDQQKIPVKTIELSKPSLDDVFLQTTGRSLREGGN